MVLSFDPLLANSKQTLSDSFEFASVPDINFLRGCVSSEHSDRFELELSSSVFLSSSGSMILRCPRRGFILSFDPLLSNSEQTSSDSFDFASLPDINFLLGRLSMDASDLFELELSSSVFLSSSGSMILRCPRHVAKLSSDPLLES